VLRQKNGEQEKTYETMKLLTFMQMTDPSTGTFIKKKNLFFANFALFFYFSN